jgi:hypothetical protein
MHQKEHVIGPALQMSFGIEYRIPNKLNTDLLGTFSGEIDRVLSPLDAAREKCKLAFEITGIDLAISSEGSFGPHPALFFAPSDEELLVLKDWKNDLEIVVKTCSLNTNYGHYTLGSPEPLESFLTRVKFPSHALIVQDNPTHFHYIKKGITSNSILNKAVQNCLSQYSECHLSTDMRAMHNPTRMEVIKELTDKLIEKMRCCCPACNRPGFGITDVKRGLLCACCSLPTNSVKTVIYSCSGCHHTEFVDYPEEKKEEDPMFCDYCNP